MTNIFLVGLGGFIGSVLRYLAGGYVQTALHRLDFPYGTLTVNLLGCFVIGLLAQLGEQYGMFSNESRSFIFVGLLGGFTTFSSFGNETLNLMRQGHMTAALMNIGANVVLGLGLVWLGRLIGNLIWR